MSLLISNLMWHTDNHAFLVHLITSLSPLFYWIVGRFGPIGACLSWRNYPSHSFLSLGFCTYETRICFFWDFHYIERESVEFYVIFFYGDIRKWNFGLWGSLYSWMTCIMRSLHATFEPPLCGSDRGWEEKSSRKS